MTRPARPSEEWTPVESPEATSQRAARSRSVAGRGWPAVGARPRPATPPTSVDQPRATHHRPFTSTSQPELPGHDLRGRHGAAPRRHVVGETVQAPRRPGRGDPHDRTVAVEDRGVDEPRPPRGPGPGSRWAGRGWRSGARYSRRRGSTIAPGERPAVLRLASGARHPIRRPVTPRSLAGPAAVQVRPPSPVWRSPRRSARDGSRRGPAGVPDTRSPTMARCLRDGRP